MSDESIIFLVILRHSRCRRETRSRSHTKRTLPRKGKDTTLLKEEEEEEGSSPAPLSMTIVWKGGSSF